MHHHCTLQYSSTSGTSCLSSEPAAAGLLALRWDWLTVGTKPVFSAATMTPSWGGCNLWGSAAETFPSSASSDGLLVPFVTVANGFYKSQHMCANYVQMLHPPRAFLILLILSRSGDIGNHSWKLWETVPNFGRFLPSPNLLGRGIQ